MAQGMNIIVGVTCPDCGEEEREKDITVWLRDHENYVVGLVLHCRKCEHVWDHIYDTQ